MNRPLERKNLLVAEATARELPLLNLTDALELTLLIARKDRRLASACRRAMVAALPRGSQRRADRRSCDGRGLPRRPRHQHRVLVGLPPAGTA
jgi:hypothetical protein